MDLFTAIVTIGIVATGLLLYYVFKDMRRMRFKIVTEYSIAKRLRELMFDNSVQAMIATDMNGMILMFNLTAEKLFGYTQEQIIGESILKLFDGDNTLSFFKDRIDDKTQLLELSAKHSDNTTFPIILFLTKLDDEGFISIGWFARQLNAELDSRKALNDKITFLEQGLCDAEVGAWSWNPLTDKLEVCKYFRYVFSLMQNEEITFPELLECIYRDDRADLPLMIRETIESHKEKYTMKYRVRKYDELKWVEVSGNIRYDKVGVPMLIHGTVKFTNESASNA